MLAAAQLMQATAKIAKTQAALPQQLHSLMEAPKLQGDSAKQKELSSSPVAALLILAALLGRRWQLKQHLQ